MVLNNQKFKPGVLLLVAQEFCATFCLIRALFMHFIMPWNVK